MTVATEVPCQSNPESFFPRATDDATTARKACGLCPFTKECATAALDVNTEHRLYGIWAGVWAGRDNNWRNRLVKIAGMVKAPPKSKNTADRPRHRDVVTHCTHGHEFTDENTQIGSRGFRVCRECNRRRAKETAARNVRTHCKRGHLVTEANLRVTVDGRRLCEDCLRPSHCKRGHAFTPANTSTSSAGKRYCLTCKRDNEAAYRKRDRKAAALVAEQEQGQP